MLSLILFFSAARDGVTFRKSSDPRISSNKYGQLIPLPAELVSLVEFFGLIHVFCASGFDATMWMVHFKRTSEID